MRTRRSLLPILACLASAQAAITNVRVLGTTATQAAISYSAPDSSACTVQVSESASYAPPVHDVDPTLFAGGNADNRPGSLSDGRARVFVAGKRTAEMALDNKYYSRALQVYTTHYYQITCGTDTATGKFSTANLMPTSYGDPFPVDASHPGNWAWPTMDWWGGETDAVPGATGTVTTSSNAATFSAGHGLVAGDVVQLTNGWPAGQEMQILGFTGANTASLYRMFFQDLVPGTTCPAPGCTWVKLNRSRGNSKQAIVDPLTGLLIRRLSAPVQNYFNEAPPLDAASGTNWTATGGAATLLTALGTAGDGQKAEWGGDGASGPGDWLYVSTAVPYTAESVDTLEVAFSGTCSGGCSGDDALIEVCIADATNAACRSAVNSLDITQASCRTAAGCTIGDQYRVLKSWVNPANPLGTLVSGGDFGAGGILVRKKTRTSGLTLDIDQVTVFVSVHTGTGWFNAGYMPMCSPQMASQTYNGVTRQGYVCYLPDNRMYWIEPESGDAALITQTWGADTLSGQNRWYNTSYQGSFDPTLPGVWYSIVPYLTGGTGVLKLTYVGDYLDIGPVDDNNSRFNYDISAQDLTAGTPLETLVQAFTAGQSAVFDPTAYSCGVLTGWADQYLKIHCVPPADAQDTLQWIVVYDPAQARVVAATRTHTVYPMRYGGLHSSNADQAYNGWINLCNNPLSILPAWTDGAGPLQTELNEILKAPGPVGVDPHDVACPALTWGRGTAGGTNKCSLVQVTGDIYDPSPGSHENSQRGSAGFLGVLQAAAPGDEFLVDAEKVQLVARAACAPASACSWTLLRGVEGTAPAQHAANTPLFGLAQNPGTISGKLFWNYVADPHGMNPTGAEMLYAPGGSHPDTNFGELIYGNSEPGNGWGYTSCPTDVPSCWVRYRGTVPQISAGTGSQIWVADSARFASQPLGATAYSDSHPAHLTAASWILDGRPYTANPTATQVWTLQPSNLYKSTTGITSIKSLPLEGTCSAKLLLDVSPGPIDASATGSYTMCVGSSCQSGAGPSDIYVNCPDLTAPSVTCGSWTDLCVYSTSSNVHQYQQADMTRNDPFGARVRNFGNLLTRDAPDGFKNIKPLGTGHALYRILNGDGIYGELALVKLPPMTFDSVNRTTFVPLQVRVGSVPAGTDNVVAEFGYDTNFYCTSRREACEAVTATVNETTPFYWASESYSGVRGAPWTIAIPSVPQRVVYYRLKYRDATNRTIQTGPTEVLVAP